MSDDEEEESYCFFGKPLEQYDEDSFPKKRPIAVEDQIATDAQGRRRFHGAFTGGFSAGFFNTVGSLEGWTPTEFKSTRQEKAQSKTQKPEDFMDDEDIGEFGIAPQTVKATKDYSTSKKRKKAIFSDCPIPGEPVLHSLLTSGNETIGYLLMKNMGIKDKIEQKEEMEATSSKVYGCEMPKSYEIIKNEDIPDRFVIPEIYKEFLSKPKDNTFGLGYSGLDKSNINLFTSSNLVVQEKNKKKLSISGQAFGVGAFEEDDEDIYVKEDMSRYDFEMTNEKEMKKKTQQSKNAIFNDFIPAKFSLSCSERFPLPSIPHSFTGKHKVKKSRFEPIPEQTENTERKIINPTIRAKYLGEESSENFTSSNTQHQVNTTKDSKQKSNKSKEKIKETNKQKDEKIAYLGLVFDRFVSASQPDDPSNILEPVKPSETTHGTKEMKNAVKLKMFGPLTRVVFDWQPCSILCKRFNVPEPNSDFAQTKNKKRTKNLIFEYQKHYEENTLKPGLTTQAAIIEEIKENQTTADDTTTIIDDGENSNKQINNSEEVTMDENIEKNSEKTENEPYTNSITENASDLAPKDITEKVDVAKNMDLFKAVFLSSSSESESEEATEESNKTEELKNQVLSENFLPKIKPIKQGILSDVDFSLFHKPNEVINQKNDYIANDSINKDDSSDKIDMNDSVPLYGPVLPKKLPTTVNVSVNSSANEANDSNDWVEKGDLKKKEKHRKKHKKDKHKHKKHKHGKK